MKNRHWKAARRRRPRIFVAVVSRMATEKPDWVLNCFQLADHFVAPVLEPMAPLMKFDGVWAVRCPTFAETGCQRIKTGVQDRSCLHVIDSSAMAKTPMKRLLSHGDTRKMTEWEGVAADTFFRSHLSLHVAAGRHSRERHTDIGYTYDIIWRWPRRVWQQVYSAGCWYQSVEQHVSIFAPVT